MARASEYLITIIQKTADHIASSDDYQWGHMGACNCGFLAQQITQLKKSEIHGYAMQGTGDWNDQLNDYCPTSGMPMDDLITRLLDAGLDIDDLKHLERLGSPEILGRMPLAERNLKHNQKLHVVRYLNAWRDLLKENLNSIKKNTTPTQGLSKRKEIALVDTFEFTEA